jgi:hypothetical protein
MRVAFGGMRPGKPLSPYAKSLVTIVSSAVLTALFNDEVAHPVMVKVAFSPNDMPPSVLSTPSSQPTCSQRAALADKHRSPAKGTYLG